MKKLIFSGAMISIAFAVVLVATAKEAHAQYGGCPTYRVYYPNGYSYNPCVPSYYPPPVYQPPIYPGNGYYYPPTYPSYPRPNPFQPVYNQPFYPYNPPITYYYPPTYRWRY